MRWPLIPVVLASMAACSRTPAPEEAKSAMQQRLAKYTTVKLEADLGGLSERERQMIPPLKDAARIMDELFWLQAYGDKLSLLAGIQDPDARRFVEINYGPWDRLDADRPFLEGAGPKPAGANFYPHDMTADEFERAVAASPDGGAALKSLYTVVRRDASGQLAARPYHEAFSLLLHPAAEKLRQAAALADDPGLKRYLELRAAALLSGDYQPSELAWMEMRDNTIDIVIGPIETYEDKLFGYKAAFESYVLVKDKEWSRRLMRYAAVLPELQRDLPVPAEYKKETPGADADLGAYDVIYYAGDCNAGSKTIAINLPNDEEVQLKKGTRRLQLKNAMRAKFERILAPMTELLIAEDQRRRVTFDAFFAETMFHEVAHGLGIKNTISGKGTVRQALKENASAIEEGKADILGLWLMTRLHERGELEADLADAYVTFVASIFRSIRFGASSAHGVSNLVRFNYFLNQGAVARDPSAGTYRVDIDKTRAAAASLSEMILRLQGDGDHAGAARLIQELGTIRPDLQADLDRVAAAGIPVDVVFDQE